MYVEPDTDESDAEGQPNKGTNGRSKGELILKSPEADQLPSRRHPKLILQIKRQRARRGRA